MIKPVSRRVRVGLGMLLGLAIFPACTSYLPFTNHLRSQFHLDTEALRHVQFYVSGNVVLRRDISLEGRRTLGGIVRQDEGRLVEEVLIRRHTPGVALAAQFEADPPKSALRMSFMPGDNTNFLLFAVVDGEAPDSDAPFLLTATSFEGQLPKVTYDNKLWSIDLSKHPQLMIRKSAFYKLKRIIHVLPGRVITP